MRAVLLAGLIIAAAVYVFHLPSGPFVLPYETPQNEKEQGRGLPDRR